MKEPSLLNAGVLMMVTDPQGSYAVLDTFTPSPLPG